MNFSLLGGLWTDIADFFTGIFALIPQFIYFFYTCIASLLDLFQFLIRKFAGLDTYYVGDVATEGDVMSNLINGILGINGSYSSLSTIFWSLIVFGVIVLILAVILSTIKGHYNYDEKKSSPKAIIGRAVKALANFAIVPVAAVLGILLSNYLLQALDSITGSSSEGRMAEVFASSNGNYSEVFVSAEDEWGGYTYASYDFFGAYSPTGHQTFSGMIFQAAAYNCNRVRYGGFTAATAGETWSDIGIFNSNLSSAGDQTEAVAAMIDFAFANNLTTRNPQTASVLKEESAVLISSYRYLQSAVWYAGTWNFNNFSKYNVGLVWYYYNLWSFNYLIGFVGVIIGLSVLTSIVLGLAGRLIECVALFLVYGPVVGITPLDDGNAFKEWRKLFVGDVLMAYGAVVGFNLLFMLLPYLQAITFFSSSLLNYIMNMVITVVLLLAVKDLVSLLSSFIGAEDPVKRGGDVKSELSKPLKQAAAKMTAAAILAAKVVKFVPGVGAAAAGVQKGLEAVKKYAAQKAKNKASKTDKQVKVMPSTYKQLQKETEEKAGGMDKEAEDLENQAADLDIEAENLDSRADLERSQAASFDKKREHSLNASESARRSADHARREAEYAERHQHEEEALAQADRDALKADLEAEYGEGAAEVDRGLEHFDATNEHAREAARYRERAEDQRMWERQYSSRADEYQAKADEYAASRDEHTANAERSENERAAKIAEADALRAQAQAKRSEAAETRASMNRYVQRDTSGIKNTLKLSGDTFKVIGTVLGFDDLVAALKKETTVVDNGKLAIREFAQSLTGADLSKDQRLMTAKEAEDFEKADVQRRATFTTESQSQNMLRQIDELDRVLRASRLRR